MNAPVRYYLVLDGSVSGPHSVDALREMASVHAFNGDCLATPEHEENWLPIHARPVLASAILPTAAKYQLKARAITPVSDSAKPVTVDELLRGNLAADARQSPPIDYTATPSRPPGRARNRDYLVAAAACNALGLALLFLLPRTPYIAVPLLAYFVVINIGLYWVFYHVMDRY
jgi:hypothetical protein